MLPTGLTGAAVLQDVDEALPLRDARALADRLEDAVHLLAAQSSALLGGEKRLAAIVGARPQPGPHRLHLIQQGLSLVREQRLDRVQRALPAPDVQAPVPQVVQRQRGRLGCPQGVLVGHQDKAPVPDPPVLGRLQHSRRLLSRSEIPSGTPPEIISHYNCSVTLVRQERL